MYSTTGITRVAGFFTTHPRHHSRRSTLATMTDDEFRASERRRIAEWRRQRRIRKRGGNGEPMTRTEAARIARAAQGYSGVGGGSGKPRVRGVRSKKGKR